MKLTMMGEMELLGRQAKTCGRCGSNLWILGELHVDSDLDDGYVTDQYIESRVCIVCAIKQSIEKSDANDLEAITIALRFLQATSEDLWQIFKKGKKDEKI